MILVGVAGLVLLDSPILTGAAAFFSSRGQDSGTAQPGNEIPCVNLVLQPYHLLRKGQVFGNRLLEPSSPTVARKYLPSRIYVNGLNTDEYY